MTPTDQQRFEWERKLYRLLGEMEIANGERSDDVEALCRVAYKLLLEARRVREDSRLVLPS